MKRGLGAALVFGLLTTAGFTFAADRGPDGNLTVQAKFDDVADLAPSAPVMLADIRIGTVEKIELAGRKALVTMSIEAAAQVPEGAIARVRRTSLLGERIVDLLIPGGVGTDAPLLKDGATIGETEVRPDLEDLVREGSDVLAPIAASEVATLVDEGAKGFGNSGDDLESVLLNLRTIVHGYAGETDTINALIDSLNAFNGTLARDAENQSLSIENTRRALDELDQESDELVKAIDSLLRLARGSNGIFEAHFDEMDRSFDQLKAILDVLREEQDALAGFLEFAPLHNRNTQLVEFEEFNEVLQDFIICGLNDDPSDPARTCEADTPNPEERGS